MCTGRLRSLDDQSRCGTPQNTWPSKKKKPTCMCFLTRLFCRGLGMLAQKTKTGADWDVSKWADYLTAAEAITNQVVLIVFEISERVKLNP